MDNISLVLPLSSKQNNSVINEIYLENEILSGTFSGQMFQS
jgi:hypothetical protein